jgi:hypothetical protein
MYVYMYVYIYAYLYLYVRTQCFVASSNYFQARALGQGLQKDTGKTTCAEDNNVKTKTFQVPKTKKLFEPLG